MIYKMSPYGMLYKKWEDLVEGTKGDVGIFARQMFDSYPEVEVADEDFEETQAKLRHIYSPEYESLVDRIRPYQVAFNLVQVKLINSLKIS